MNATVTDHWLDDPDLRKLLLRSDTGSYGAITTP